MQATAPQSSEETRNRQAKLKAEQLLELKEEIEENISWYEKRAWRMRQFYVVLVAVVRSEAVEREILFEPLPAEESSD